jgi:hypothetical protein
MCQHRRVLEVQNARDTSIEHRDRQYYASNARAEELAAAATAGRVYVVMGTANAVRNATEARASGEHMKQLIRRFCLQTQLHRRRAPRRTWGKYWTFGLSLVSSAPLPIVPKGRLRTTRASIRQARQDRERATVDGHDDTVGGHDGRRQGSFGKKIGQTILGFEKRDAPLHLQRRMSTPPRP